MRCDFCESMEMQGFNSNFEMESGEFITIDILSRELYIEFEFDDIQHEDSVKIKYCPMCGRHL